MNNKDLIEFDRKYLWHPYTSMTDPIPAWQVTKASGCRLTLANGEELVDGMSSWWCAIHGYNVKELNEAAISQLNEFSHVMFGGLTHRPAVELGQLLIEILPGSLNRIFYSDSGSVSVEVSMKMAIQYWHEKGSKEKNKFLTIRRGYHGDTFHAMSVCDPVTGMHKMYKGILPEYIFIDEPRLSFYDDWDDNAFTEIKNSIEKNKDKLAAVILEPIVQGAGGMRFYHPQYLNFLRNICDKNDILLIFDEIATGFGRTGKLFAFEHSGVTPDILTIGKALTGGYLSLAATVTTPHVAEVISSKGLPFMHGPTFMGNPLACSIAVASLKLLLNSGWKKKVSSIERQMIEELDKCKKLNPVNEVRVLGAIGVVELHKPVDLEIIQKKFVELGVWIRPFGKLVYIMPPYIITKEELTKLTTAIYLVIKEL